MEHTAEIEWMAEIRAVGPNQRHSPVDRVSYPAAGVVPSMKDIDQGATTLGCQPRPVVGVAHADQGTEQVLGVDVRHEPRPPGRGNAAAVFPH